jgi:glycosyl hydrolase family 20
MPDTPQTAQTPAPGSAEQQQMQQLMARLMQRIAQPHTVGPQPQQQPKAFNPTMTQGPGPQQTVHGLLGLIANVAAHNKQVQLDHATNRIKNISDAIEDAYEHAQGDEAKAKEFFMASPAVKSLMSKEGQKDMKQMEKLLQYDFINPEKKKTVWHEALERVIKLSGAEKVMKGLRTLMGQHKDKMAEEVKKQGEAQHGQQQASELAKTMFQGARQERIDPTKALPSLISSEGADLRQRERLLHDQWKVEQKEAFDTNLDKLKSKDMKLWVVGKGIQASLDGDEEAANKFFAQASKAYSVSQKPAPMNLNTAINDAVNATDIAKKTAALKWIDEYQKIQGDILSKRGLSFGMGRLYNWYNSETGESVAMNGFQAQEAMKGGEKWIMSTPISPQLLLPAQQIIRSMNVPDPTTNKSLRDDLVDDMKVFDNSSDRTIISRVLRENPSVYSQDVSTLGTWLDQNLTSQLSPEGQKLVRDVKMYAEVFNRTAAITGQTRTEMNTMMLLALLPNERTPSKEYGKKQLDASFNYLDSMVQAPLLGGAKLKSATPKAAAPEEKPRAISLDN